MDEMLVTVAQRAKKELETISKRQVMEEGRWKRIARSKPECQSFESISKAKDQYSVLVEMDLPCSLREIMSVYSTDNLAEFHRSMEAIFGDQYVYGVNIRTADCASIVEQGNSMLRSRPQGRRASAPATSHGYEKSINTNVLPLRSAKLHVNAVTLMQKHHLVWKQRNMTFMDYLEEDIETKSVTRVMQTMDMQDEDLECSSIAMSFPTAVSSNQECLFQQHTQHGIDLRRELKGILAGYIIQEDSDEKLTRVFFHATHHHRPSSWHGPTRMPRSAVQLLRAMVNKVCLLETVILRRRLGYYPLTRLPTCSDVALRCAACCVPFNMLRKRYVCRLCGHHTCRKCSDVQEVEKTVGQVEKHRVCASCVRRVSYCVFSMCAFPPKTASNVRNTSRTSPRSPQPIERNVKDDDFDPPIMDDLASNDFEHVEVFHSNQNGVFAGFVSHLLHDKDKKRDIDSHRKQDFTAQGRQNLTAAKRRQRLQLNIDDLNPWAPGPPPLDGQNTPKESICILDSFGISDPSTSPRLRELLS
ncbi:hypothetical protein KXD40_008041 [Peronospora effusa]|uniref:FYVE-type domain-containing protein n=1 Tax=Peronospora effusa TaxID=542832 RepID=A0A3M6V9R8_9STRA|nr:hypothetical protein DD238_007072 [Peronospora effusa]RQM12415.1 hypothetical protein DD237_000962 [Peronospora effusa]UIZ24080.1 hypothetical protein KXD40_008041 [Peronospora effusa]CAI5714991.1 unnamed protein product [Peronospora effusa]